VVLPVKSFDDEHFVFMCTAQGTVKKTPLSEFSRPRPSGIIAVDLDEGDFLVGAAITDGRHDVMLFSDGGKAVRFDEQDVRPMGRTARGVRGMRLPEGQRIISLVVSNDPGQTVLTATENGYGKRTPVSQYPRHGRGTQGTISIQISERNGKALSARLVHAGDEVMLITTGGVLIRTRVAEIRELGRNTQGVTLIGLGEGEKLAGLERVAEAEDEGAEAEDGPSGEDEPGEGGEAQP
jgi:DNA gyrase subunit A